MKIELLHEWVGIYKGQILDMERSAAVRLVELGIAQRLPERIEKIIKLREEGLI